MARKKNARSKPIGRTVPSRARDRNADRTTVWVLPDQLRPDTGPLRDLAPGRGTVLFVESLAEARRLPWHKQRLVLIWSAMRHFADDQRRRGHDVDYRAWQPDARTALSRHVRERRPARLRVMESAEIGPSREAVRLARGLGLEVEEIPNGMFLSDRADFARRARGRKTLLLEAFYRRMRKKTGLLMRGREPAGGRWNYDAMNREPVPAGTDFPPPPRYEPDAVTRDLIRRVGREFPGHFGDAGAFAWPVTRSDAQHFFEDFLDHRLDRFGPYEDAIVTGEAVLFHSLLSPLLNIGLLDPLEVCRRAEERYRDKHARLNSVEGFIRQILGWREFVYQVYHLAMPDYARRNHFKAKLPLPRFYWDGETDMHCAADAVKGLMRRGINHHIQRLMITGNFALLAGIEPRAVNRWYWLAYADAWEWVVTPNVLGLALHADGGLLATKPYAASANYINRMSDCCRGCRYDHRRATGKEACPFNALFWDFLARNRSTLARNPRMNLMMSQLKRRGRGDLSRIRARAAQIRGRLKRGERI